MNYKRLYLGFGLLVSATVAACTSVLPSSTNSTQILWKSYAEAKLAYDSVDVDVTRQERLVQIGFGPESVPNVHVLNFVDVANLFGSSFTYEELPEGVKTCIKARDKCVGYVVSVQNMKNQRNGNIAMDLFGFRKQTHVTGWAFEATFVLVHDTVAYKLWNGKPKIENLEKSVTPLGPMQNLGGIIPRPF
ncbi:MAG: hypothetical protein COY40_05650 [Alphaproteobacteria bacterium CG_4_10_14_0_8_um_filter_53_9]|nr:MAG: hypothetical protein COY40_05650 [Alphaproteobacteria bacterium CG_4_10_14_0_8_um_filter_53_9]